MQSNIFYKTMIPICPLRGEILLFLSSGLEFLYEGFSRFLVAGSTLQPRVWECWDECWSLSETNQEAFYMQIQRELRAPCRDERIQMEEHLLLLHPLQLPHHQNMENS